MRTLPERFSEVVEPGDNVLLLCPSFEDHETGACTDLLSADGAGRRSLLGITLADSPGTRLRKWDQYVDTSSLDAAIITVDVNLRSAASERPGRPSDVPANVAVDRVSSPSNLTSLGVRITDRLDGWTTDGIDRQITLCFDSVTTLMQYATLDETRRFLGVVTDRSAAAGAIAHYHIDPQAHSETMITELGGLFDVAYEYANGAWSVHTR